MTPAQLQQLRERFPIGSINTLSADGVHELLTHISTLESELQQVRVERDGMRELVRDCDEFLYAHHEIGNLRRLNESGTCGVCRDSKIFERINAALAPAPAARTETE